MSWLFYLLEANLYLIIFYCFFKIFLNKDTFYSLNRYYLIFSTLISFLIPFFKVGIWSREVINVVENTVYTQQAITTNAIMIQHPQIVESAFTLNSFIFTVYLVVTLLFIFRLTKGFISIMKIKGLNEYGIKNGIRIIHLEKSNAAFSFFNLLFIDPELENQSTIRKHEMAHIKQGHSFDILFYELIGAINWFNPVVYLLKKDIKLIHEYLADLEVTDSEMKKYDYAMFLIKRSINLQNLTLTNQIFNSSLLKKRIFMLNQNKTAGWVKLKMLFVLPIICGMLGLSTMAFTKTYGVLDLYSNAIIKQDTIKSNSIIEGLMIREEGTKINLYFRYNDLLKKGMPVSKKLFVVNGKLIEPGSFGGIENADYFIELNSDNGMKKYGKKAEFGVIEAVGKNIKILDIPSPPPPGRPDKPNLSLLPPPPPGEPKVKTEKYPNPTATKNFVLDRRKNDKFILPEMSSGRKSVQILSLSGKRIYATFNYVNDWDGKLSNIQMLKDRTIPAGKYVYVVLITKKDKQPNDAKKGYLTII